MLPARLFSLDSVRLRPGPFLDAQHRDEAYFAQLDAERLLAPFLREAGLPHAAPYGNWESDGLDGHIGGHYLSAVAALAAATGNETYRDLAAQFVARLAAAQAAHGDGYLGGIPNSREFWHSVRNGIDPQLFETRWAPLYNFHKTLAGLFDAATLAQVPLAVKVASHLVDWWIAIASGIDDDSFEMMLDTEFGGMGETLTDLAELLNRPEILREAARFHHRRVLDPLLADEDALTGLHANTQIPKALAYVRLAQATGDRQLHKAGVRFWKLVAEQRTVSIGGHGVNEHFHAPDDFERLLLDREGPESCNTYNMVKLGLGLFELDGDVGRIELIERMLVNHVLSAQHPEHGGFTYFTPIRPSHYRVYSRPEVSMWCCVGTGLEAHARHGAGVFAHCGDEELLVLMPIAAEVTWPERGVRVEQDSSYPERFDARLTIRTSELSDFRLGIRVPDWAHGEIAIRVQGREVSSEIEDGIAHIHRTWSDGDVVEYSFHPRVAVVNTPDDSAWASYIYGPIVLAAPGGTHDQNDQLSDEHRVGHIARGALDPISKTPVVHGVPQDVTVLDDGPSFALDSSRGAVNLAPFYKVHDERYTIYFPVGRTDDRIQQLRDIDDAQLSLDGRTVDRVQLGEQQPEADHTFQGWGSTGGRTEGTAWRQTTREMSVLLHDFRRYGRMIRIESLAADGPLGYEVTVDGRPFPPISDYVQEGVRVTLVPIVAGDDKKRHIRLSAGDRPARVATIRLLAEQP